MIKQRRSVSSQRRSVSAQGRGVSSQRVGWVEAPIGAVTHRRDVMGSASLHPSYEGVHRARALRNVASQVSVRPPPTTMGSATDAGYIQRLTTSLRPSSSSSMAQANGSTNPHTAAATGAVPKIAFPAGV